jgi:hypothetical protein
MLDAMIEEAPTFFVPDVPAEEQEDSYKEMADFCHRPALPPDQRIYSIVYTHDSVEWTASVGRQLRGTKTTLKRGRELRTPHSDSATVLAIFPGNPYLVVTDKGPHFGNARSQWENPFMVGQPNSVTRFRSA